MSSMTAAPSRVQHPTADPRTPEVQAAGTLISRAISIAHTAQPTVFARYIRAAQARLESRSK